jgi:hypothetical protein
MILLIEDISVASAFAAGKFILSVRELLEKQPLTLQ